EPVRIFDRARIHLFVFRAVDPCAVFPFFGNGDQCIGHDVSYLMLSSSAPGRGGSLRMEDGVFENFTGGFIARHLPSVGWSRSWKKFTAFRCGSSSTSSSVLARMMGMRCSSPSFIHSSVVCVRAASRSISW